MSPEQALGDPLDGRSVAIIAPFNGYSSDCLGKAL
jgi:hypothetical protein